MKYQCPACQCENELKFDKTFETEIFKCDFCAEEFFYIEGVYFVLTAEEDFYNVKRKLRRFVEQNNAKD